MPLHDAMFVQSNPIPVKWALYHMKKIPEGIRLPLTPLEAEYRDVVTAACDRLAGV